MTLSDQTLVFAGLPLAVICGLDMIIGEEIKNELIKYTSALMLLLYAVVYNAPALIKRKRVKQI